MTQNTMRLDPVNIKSDKDILKGYDKVLQYQPPPEAPKDQNLRAINEAEVALQKLKNQYVAGDFHKIKESVAQVNQLLGHINEPAPKAPEKKEEPPKPV